MTFAAGTSIYDFDPSGNVTITTSTGTLATDTVDSESKTAIGLDASGNAASLCDLVLNLTMAVSAGAGTSVLVYRRDLNVDSTSDSPVPDANYKGVFVGSFLVDSGTSAQTLFLSNVPLAGYDAEFYIDNQTGQTIANTPWTLKGILKGFNVAT